MNVLEFESVAKRLQRDVRGHTPVLLENVSFSVAQGSCHGFVGANGAGKSTSLRIAVGAATPSTGTVTLFGRAPTSTIARQGLGFAPDTPAVDPSLTATETLALHWQLLGKSGKPRDLELERVELAHRANEPVASFSKGMLQRLSLAVALLGDPEFLVLDEPMSGLDPAGRELVRRLIHERHQSGSTVLFSSHVLSDIESLCTDVTVIDKGRSRFSGKIESLLGAPRGYKVVFDARGAAHIPKDLMFRQDGTHLVATAPSDEALRATLDIGHKHGFAISHIETLRPSLEEAVISLVSVSK